jgi:hypothetical protein
MKLRALKYSQEEQIVFASPLHGRLSIELEHGCPSLNAYFIHSTIYTDQIMHYTMRDRSPAPFELQRVKFVIYPKSPRATAPRESLFPNSKGAVKP